VTSAFAAAAQQAQQAAAPAAQSAGQTNPLGFDKANLFGKPSELGGSGTFTPTPPLDALFGRTLVYIPRSFNPAAPDPFATEPGKTRKQWTADLYVLDGGTLKFWYKQKADPNATPPRPEGTVEWVQEDVSPTNPFVALGTWVSQAAFVSKLTAASEARQFLIGTPARGAQKAQRDRGVTDEQVAQEHAAWVARGKQGAEPKFVWILKDVPDMAPVLAWWEKAQETVKL
jgi:hypothetical protein